MSKFVAYKAKDGFRWRLVADNGNVIAESGEAYARRPNAKMLTRVRKQLAAASFEISARG